MCRSRPYKSNPEIWAHYKMLFMENLPSLHLVGQLTLQSELGLFTSVACDGEQIWQLLSLQKMRQGEDWEAREALCGNSKGEESRALQMSSMETLKSP